MDNHKQRDYDQHYPDAEGHFGPYGGRFVGETLIAAIEELDKAYRHEQQDETFQTEVEQDLANFVGRP